jgi:hypothetical protein
MYLYKLQIKWNYKNYAYVSRVVSSPQVIISLCMLYFLPILVFV